MKKSIKVFLSLAVVAVVGGVGIWKLASKPVKYETEEIKRGNIISEVSVTGSLQPAERVNLEPETSGRVVKIAVKEGDLVKAGDTLIALDTRDLQARLASQRAAVSAARAQLSQLLAGATAEDLALSQRSVDAAAARVEAARQAKLDAEASLVNAEQSRSATADKSAVQIASKLSTMLDDYAEAVTDAYDAINRLDNPLYNSDDTLTFSASDSQAVSDATNTRRDAKSAFTTLESRVSRVRAAGTLDVAVDAYADNLSDLRRIKAHLDRSADALAAAISLSSTTLSTYQLNVKSAQSSVTSAIDSVVADKSSLDVQAKLNASEATSAEIAVTGARTAVNSASSNITAAERALAEAQAALTLKKSGNRKETVDAQRANVAAAEAAVSGLETDLAKRTLTAPMDAVVTDVNVKRGETVMPGKTAISLNAQGRFEIISNISEVDIARVAVGAPVSITLDAFTSDQAWTGKVTRINPAEKVVEGVIFYETRVLFDQDDARLKSGMTANLVIEVARRENVLRLPLRSVKEKDGKKTVQLLVAGKPEERVVKLGLQNNEYVEVSEGVVEGDTVIVGSAQ
jgi:multidrug efflux pump subunit AcrA (membrane-fusion protein)